MYSCMYVCMCTPSIPAGRPNNGDAAVLLLYTCTIDRKNKNDTYGTGTPVYRYNIYKIHTSIKIYKNTSSINTCIKK